MNILINGASGFIGKHLLMAIQQVIGEGDKLITPSSRIADYTRLHRTEDWLPLLDNVDIVINAVGIITEQGERTFDAIHHQAPRALFDACLRAGVKKVIQISALGVEQAITPYQSSKLAADDYLQTLELDWLILRPSLVYGAGGKSSTLFHRLASLPLWILPDGGRQMIQPVHVSDLADAVVTCLNPKVSQKIINVVGAEALSLAQWLQSMRRQQNKNNAIVLSVPYKLVIAAASLLSGIFPLLHADNLKMLHAGNTASIEDLAELLDRNPLSIEEVSHIDISGD